MVAPHIWVGAAISLLINAAPAATMKSIRLVFCNDWLNLTCTVPKSAIFLAPLAAAVDLADFSCLYSIYPRAGVIQ